MQNAPINTVKMKVLKLVLQCCKVVLMLEISLHSVESVELHVY